MPGDTPGSPASTAVFAANNQAFSLAGLNRGSKPQATQETQIASNVYPQGHPVVAALDSGEVFLAWVYDDINKPVMQGKEIYFTHYSSGSWSTPAGITNDSFQDFNPQTGR